MSSVRMPLYLALVLLAAAAVLALFGPPWSYGAVGAIGGGFGCGLGFLLNPRTRR